MFLNVPPPYVSKYTESLSKMHENTELNLLILYIFKRIIN